MHPHAFRSGEWAKIKRVEICATPDDPTRVEAACFRVKFEDGATDLWLFDDKDAQYEFRNELSPTIREN
jgi:hypothetical protein